MNDLTNRVAFVTGASGGYNSALERGEGLIQSCRIGAAISIALARLPLKALALHYSRSAESAEKLRTSLTNSFPSLKITLHQADLSQAQACETLVEEVLKAHKTVDIFISNAGAARRITDIL
jgi:NAD(P)-dependent dehydrogenase (short-subunit alcohol dehydrogenase family)